MTYKKEQSKLENIVNWYSTRGDYTAILVKYSYLSLEPFFKGRKCLKLGCGDGLMTKYLVNVFKKVVALDGSKKICIL